MQFPNLRFDFQLFFAVFVSFYFLVIVEFVIGISCLTALTFK